MIPGAGEYLSFLMGGAAISDDQLERLGIRIVQGAGSAFRSLLIPGASLRAYRTLVRERITPGFWNDIIGREEILFVFKLPDGRVEELAYSEASGAQIAALCTALNDDPIEETSDLPRYLAGNSFYHESMVAFHNVGTP